MLAGYGRSAAGGGATQSRSNDARIIQALDAHERYARGEPGGLKAILRNMQLPAADFTGRLLSGADFSNCNLAGSRMDRIIGEDIVLYCADLRGVSLRDAYLTGADLRGASLKAADLTGAMMDGADLRKAVMAVTSGHQLTGAVQQEAVAVDFSDASMKGARLGGAKLENANFKGAILHNADFEGAQLSGADFDGAVLTGVSLEQMRLPPSAFRNCVTEPTHMAMQALPSIRAMLELAEKWVISGGKLGSPARLDRMDLRPLGRDLAGAKLTAASMSEVLAIGVDFSNAQLQGANLSGADLRDANFTDADLRGVKLTGARLRGAVFKRANMRPLDLANGAMRAVDFTGASYNPTSLIDAIR
jgi:uncharacterized protein YjbI with pentapeptide repeats